MGLRQWLTDELSSAWEPSAPRAQPNPWGAQSAWGFEELERFKDDLRQAQCASEELGAKAKKERFKALAKRAQALADFCAQRPQRELLEDPCSRQDAREWAALGMSLAQEGGFGALWGSFFALSRKLEAPSDGEGESESEGARLCLRALFDWLRLGADEGGKALSQAQDDFGGAGAFWRYIQDSHSMRVWALGSLMLVPEISAALRESESHLGSLQGKARAMNWAESSLGQASLVMESARQGAWEEARRGSSERLAWFGQALAEGLLALDQAAWGWGNARRKGAEARCRKESRSLMEKPWPKEVWQAAVRAIPETIQVQAPNIGLCRIGAQAKEKENLARALSGLQEALEIQGVLGAFPAGEGARRV